MGSPSGFASKAVQLGSPGRNCPIYAARSRLQSYTPARHVSGALCVSFHPQQQGRCSTDVGAYYRLVGDSAKKPAEFVTAVQVAQEMAVLAPSIQDRPLLPACYVIMGDPPENVKNIFRKWRAARTVDPGESMCVPVADVLQDLGITL